MSRQVLSNASSVYALDSYAQRLVADFKSGSGSESAPIFRYVSEVTLVLGHQWSYAYVGMPVASFGDEQAPTVALQSSGPAGMRLRTRARVSMVDGNGKSVPLMVGYLVQLAHSIDDDSCVGMIIDDRWLLSKVTCFGKAFYDPISKAHWFDAGVPLVFGADRLPDCIDTPHGPRFAPGPCFGYTPGGSIGDILPETYNEPAPGAAKKIARSWRCSDVLQYLRDMHHAGRRPQHPQDYGNQNISPCIEWPSNVGSLPGFERWCRNFSAENVELGTVLAKLARKAGPYEINIEPSEWNGKLGLVKVTSQASGLELATPTYGNPGVGGLTSTTRLGGGAVVESAIGWFDDVVIAGDPPALEHRFSDEDEETPQELMPAWTIDEETNFKAIIDDNGNDEAAFLMACRAEPKVYAAYKINPATYATFATNWPAWYPPYHPRILERLLSGYSENAKNPLNWNPREIIIEWFDEEGGEDGEGEWHSCSRFDDLTLIDDGRAFLVDGLRSGAERVTFHSDEYDTENMSANKMRLTCAVEREFRITAIAKEDPNKNSGRVETDKERFTFLAVAARGDHVHWERYQSFPNGGQVIEPELSERFPDKCAREGGYLFSDLLQEVGGESRIQRHANRRLEDVKRLGYSGVLRLHVWNPSIHPGMPISVSTGNSIRPRGVVGTVRFNSTSQTQEIEIYSPEDSQIYDMPTASPSSSSSSSETEAGTETGTSAPSSTAAETAPAAPATYTTDRELGQYVPEADHSAPATPAESSWTEDRRRRFESGNQQHRDAGIISEIGSQQSQGQEERWKTIRTGDEMSKPNDYSPAGWERRREEREEELVRRALRKSVQTEAERQETE